jgi:hypothetical protein
MTHWVKSHEDSTHKAGHVQWYLCDTDKSGGMVVGEVVQINEELGTYYAELTNGRGLRYFTDVDVAKDWLWSFYCLERAS